jgi:hypothetical protein
MISTVYNKILGVASKAILTKNIIPAITFYTLLSRIKK